MMPKSDIKSRVENLSLKQQQLLLQQLKQLQQKKAKENKNRLQLVAYVKGTDDVMASDLKAYVKEQLPNYMMPSNFVLIDDFPRLPNGKIDQKALPELYYESSFEETEYVAPTSEIERKLAEVWEEILNFSPIGTTDNFFEIGGDSILSIQIIAKARQYGIILAVNQLFEHQTIGELALFAQTQVQKQVSENIIETGEIDLTPIQHWFFEKHQTAPHFWNQAMILTPDFSISSETAKQAIEYLVERQDVLRLRFTKENEKWQATIESPKVINAFQTSDDTVEDVLIKVQSNFSLSSPNLFQCVYLKKSNSLLFVAHHLVIDNIAWNILLEDFITICQQINQKQAISLPSIVSSFKTWSDNLQNLAKEKTFRKEYDFWKSQIANSSTLPTDYKGTYPIEEDSIITIIETLDKSTTNSLLQEVHAAYHTKAEDLLITALAQTINTWTNFSTINLGLERHGREAGKLNASNTVGWFTSYFPLQIEIEKGNDIGKNIKSIKEQIRQIPNGGIGYGILRYLENDKTVHLNHQPTIVFNYLGNLSGENPRILGKVEPIMTNLRHPKSERHYLLEINVYISHQKLHIVWRFSKHFYKKETIQQHISNFKTKLEQIITHCINTKNSEYTPSDFPEAGLNQGDLDNLLDLLG